MKLPYRFGRYTLIEKIANGGTAEVYRALLNGEQGFAKTVAVKRLLPAWGGSDELRQMLIDEARVLVHLQHQAIVQVFELGHCEGSPFLAMEFIDGLDSARLLTEIIRDKTPLPIIHAVYIMIQVLLALEFAHRSINLDGEALRIVHRDISPSNILLSWNGEVKVTDFGIAKGIHRTHETQVGQLRGKYAYMAPEQARGFPIDARADIFACGIVFYELLTALRLFDAKTDDQVLERVRKALVPQDSVNALPPEIRAILMIALAPDPEKRYQSASEMLTDIQRFTRSSGNAGSSLEFAEYLREKFPRQPVVRYQGGVPQQKRGEAHTKIMESQFSARTKSQVPKALRAAGVCAVLSFMALMPQTKNAEGVSLVSRQAEKTPEVRVERAEKAPPAIGGAVAVDSKPSGAKGKLIIGESVREFETPFSIDGIKIGDSAHGKIELAAAGFESQSFQFELSPQSPAFVKYVELKKVESATLSVQARPWGLLYLGGHANGRETPVNNLRVKPGEYSVSVKHPPSGKTATARVALSGGDSKRCIAEFGASPVLRCR